MEPTQEAANLANIKTARYTVWILVLTALLCVVGIVTLYFVASPPSQTTAANSGGELAVKNWLVIILSVSIGLAAVSLVFSSYRLLKGKRVRDALIAAQNTIQRLTSEAQERAEHDSRPSVEIVSPFDGDEVGLYDVIRGRVFPADRHLQVFVFAGDNKWYLQRHVVVSGTKWSVKCQFGNPDTPSAGVYRIAAVLDSHLNEGMWYADLPNGVRSNAITVHRPEITVDRRLSEATGSIEALRTDLDKARGDSRAWERKYHEVNNTTTLVEKERDNYKNQIAQLKQDSAADKEGHKLELTAERIEKNTLKERLEKKNRDLTEAHKIIRDEKNQKETLYQLYQDEKSKYEKLLWVKDIIEKQEKAISNHVLIDKLSKVRVDLIDSPDTGPPRIRFGFHITNDSLFQIIVQGAEVSGHVSFRGRNLRESVSQDLNVQGVPTISALSHKGAGWLFLEQEFTNAEVDRIKNALNIPDARFGFEDITIEVGGETRFPDVDRQPLQIPVEFRTVLLKDCDIKSNTNNA